MNLLEAANREWIELHLWQKAVLAGRRWAFRKWDREGQTFFEGLFWEIEERIERLR